jgi:cytochrome c biogenesis protein CcmG/thiol:disulfide interchange protein DsbE
MYKKIGLLFIGITLTIFLSAQNNSKIGTALVKTLDGKNFSTDSLKNSGKPILISFWATWCKPCVAELNAINDNYIDWQKETGVKVIAISVDDARTMNNVAPFVNGRNWNYEVYLDPNGDFQRAMSVNLVPHSFVINGKREIVTQHTSYNPGDEDKLYEEIKKAVSPK